MKKTQKNENNHQLFFKIKSSTTGFLQKKRNNKEAVILSPLCPASLMRRNPQRYKIIHVMRCKDRSIDLNMSICIKYSVCVISVAVIMAVF